MARRIDNFSDFSLWRLSSFFPDRNAGIVVVGVVVAAAAAAAAAAVVEAAAVAAAARRQQSLLLRSTPAPQGPPAEKQIPPVRSPA